MAHFPEDLHEGMRERAATLGIRPEDIEEFHTHGHGHGGMKINKAITCVELTHHPTGVTVRYQHHRGLQRNRVDAYALLIQKIEEHLSALEKNISAEKHRIEAQKRGRTPKGKRKTLKAKRHRSVTKDLRKPPEEDSGNRT